MVEKWDDRGFAHRGEEFLQIFKKGAEFTQELLKENERLRYYILQIEEAGTRPAESPVAEGDADMMKERIAALEQEKQEILRHIKQVEQENLDFANRYVDIETQNNQLANLYIASFQLHSTLDYREVLQVIMEIVINLIGAETFAIMLFDEKSNTLRGVVAEDVECGQLPVVTLGQGIIGEAAEQGESYFVENIADYSPDLEKPMVCIPLKIKERVIGAIVIYKLLVQKNKFAEVDYELFSLLGGHAATAIFSSKLYAESERRLSTYQEFINLLTTSGEEG